VGINGFAFVFFMDSKDKGVASKMIESRQAKSNALLAGRTLTTILAGFNSRY
jgi:hypothetical protein